MILRALPFEMVTIFGAALGAFLANNQPKVVKASISGLAKCFKGSKFSKARYMELLALLYEILQKARKEGLMSIENDVEEPASSPLFQKYPTISGDHHVVEFITDYLRMMVSGNFNAHEIETLMGGHEKASLFWRPGFAWVDVQQSSGFDWCEFIPIAGMEKSEDAWPYGIRKSNGQKPRNS